MYFPSILSVVPAVAINRHSNFSLKGKNPEDLELYDKILTINSANTKNKHVRLNIQFTKMDHKRKRSEEKWIPTLFSNSKHFTKMEVFC